MQCNELSLEVKFGKKTAAIALLSLCTQHNVENQVNQIAGTSFQHWLGVGVRGQPGEVVFASGVCTKARICLRLLSKIVAFLWLIDSFKFTSS